MTRYAERLERISEGLRARGVDVLALLPGANFTYCTGLRKSQTERPIILFLLATRRPALVVPALERGTIAAAIPFPADFYSYTDESGPTGAFRAAVRELRLARTRIGVEPLGMRLLEWQGLARGAEGCAAEDLSDLLSSLRMTKDAGELDAMREAARITEAALATTIREVKPGRTEREVEAALYIALLRAGCEEFAFEAQVLSGPRGALQHVTASDRRIEAGDALIFDVGAAYRGYLADLTRTFALGHATNELRSLYEIVFRANAAARAAVAPGASAESVDRAARRVIEDAGYGEAFFHRTGHGLGLEIHEPPYIVAGNRLALRPGMTFTIEPGIYLSGRLGVRIEDDVVVTAAGCESLTTYPRELTVV